MNDRELLERASKAAGIECNRGNLPHERGMLFHNKVEWNPLTDDGDAFRLMVTLGMEIKCYSNVIVVTTPDGVDEEELTGEEICKPDELAATRRAIVRAAAAMVEEK